MSPSPEPTPSVWSPDPTGDSNAFTSYDIQACLHDERRVQHFKNAIFEVVRPGDVVVDGGSGTGILGMLAAQAGASKVYCVELNPEYVDVLTENARRNGMEAVIIPIQADATSVDLPEPVDVIVSEVISAGFFYEPQLQVVNNLLRFLRPGGAIVPQTMTNYVELISAQQYSHGFRFDFDARWRHLDGDISLTTRGKYLSVDFRRGGPDEIHCTTRVRALESGIANAIEVSYGIEFSDGEYSTQPTEFLLNPQMVFIPNPVEIRSGDLYDVTLSYQAGCSARDCKVEIRPSTDERRAIFLPSSSDISNVETFRFENANTSDVRGELAEIDGEPNSLSSSSDSDDGRIAYMKSVLASRVETLRTKLDADDPKTRRLLRALADDNDGDLERLGLATGGVWLDEMVATLANMRTPVAISLATVAPSSGRNDHLSADRQVGVSIAQLIRDVSGHSTNLHVNVLVNDLDPDQWQSDDRLATARMLEQLGIIGDDDVEGNDYTLAFESQLGPAVDTLIERLRESGRGYINEYDNNVVFFPNADSVDHLVSIPQKEKREYRRYGISIHRNGVPTSAASTAAALLASSNEDTFHMSIIDVLDRSNTYKTYALLNALDIANRSDYRELIFDANLLSPEQTVYALCVKMTNGLERYAARAQRFDEWGRFDPIEYMQRNYGEHIFAEDQAIIEFAMERLPNPRKGEGSFELVADVGPGPNLYPTMLLASCLSDGGTIDLIEHAAPNRAFLDKMLSGNDEASFATWRRFETLMLDFDGERYPDLLERLRNATRVVEGSIYSLPTEKYDVVTSYFSTESITPSLREFWKTIRQLAKAIKPGGLVVAGHMIGSHEYYAGSGTRFPAVSVSIEDLEEAYSDAGLTFEILPVGEGAAHTAREGYRGMAGVVARRSH